MVRLFNSAHITKKVRVAIPKLFPIRLSQVVNSDQT